MSQQHLIGYHKGTGIIYDLSAVSKLLFFLIVTILAMVTYDTRLIAFVALFSLSLFFCKRDKVLGSFGFSFPEPGWGTTFSNRDFWMWFSFCFCRSEGDQ